MLNVDGFYEGVLTTLNVMVERGFLRSEDRSRVVSVGTAEDLLEGMA